MRARSGLRREAWGALQLAIGNSSHAPVLSSPQSVTKITHDLAPTLPQEELASSNFVRQKIESSEALPLNNTRCPLATQPVSGGTEAWSLSLVANICSARTHTTNSGNRLGLALGIAGVFLFGGTLSTTAARATIAGIAGLRSFRSASTNAAKFVLV
jgi:hypothetical protein